MMKWILDLLGVKTATYVPVEPGAEYVLTGTTGNPFDTTIVRVTVKDVQNGWVLYDMHPLGGMFQSQSMELDMFTAIYRMDVGSTVPIYGRFRI